MTDKQPKLCTRKTYIIALFTILFGSSLGIFRELHETGAVTGVTIGASLFALVIGIIIIVVVGRYANKPEKNQTYE